MINKLEKILADLDEAIKADDSGTCHLIIAKSAIENAIKAIERSVSHIMASKFEGTREEYNKTIMEHDL